MDKIVEYEIICTTTRGDMNTTVMTWIKTGWQPLGGHVTHATPGFPDEYQQTMVRYEAPGS